MTDQAVGHPPDVESSLYLELLKQVLTRTGFGETYRLLDSRVGLMRRVLNPPARRLLDSFGLELRRRVTSSTRQEGRDWPADAETMIGRPRLDNIEHCVTDVIRSGVPGDLMETGVWRGGATIFMRAILRLYGVTDRVVWLADSFQGLPKPDSTRYRPDAGDRLWTAPVLAVSLEEVKANFERYGLLDEQVRFLPGWFRDTLPTAPVERLAVLRLDGDMYESTMIALDALYPRLSPGGYLIVDDYGAIPACRSAVEDYRRAHAIHETMQTIDWSGVFWQVSPAAHG